MHLLILMVIAFVVFLVLYARYMNANGSISKRRIQIDNLRDQVEFRVKKLNAGTEQINKDIAEARFKLDGLKDLWKESVGDDDVS